MGTEQDKTYAFGVLTRWVIKIEEKLFREHYRVSLSIV